MLCRQIALALVFAAGSAIGQQTTVAALHPNGGGVHLRVEGADLQEETLHVNFPAGSGYVEQTVTLRW
jgi:hypothetical protein